MRYLIVLIFVLCSCSWTTKDRISAVTSVSCIAADVGTTFYGREVDGLHEINPIAESYLVWAGFNLGLIGVAYALGEYDPENRWIYWLAMGTSRCGFAAWNVYQINKN